jgi:hypothetical protein
VPLHRFTDAWAAADRVAPTMHRVAEQDYALLAEREAEAQRKRLEW